MILNDKKEKEASESQGEYSDNTEIGDENTELDTDEGEDDEYKNSKKLKTV